MAQVLIVDDDKWMADCYSRWLQHDGHFVSQVGNVQDALDSLDESLPQVIMVDLFLPDANGIQLLHTLRSYDDLMYIPIILCSAAPPLLSTVAAYGVSVVLDKALLTPRVLQATIRQVLAR